MSRSLLAALVLLTSPFAHAKTAQVEVTYVTASRAFLNRGALDGVREGQTLSFVRNGRSAGKCTVDKVAPHSSSCTGAALRRADVARIELVTREEPKAVRVPRPAAPAQLRAQRAQVLDAPAPRVVSEAKPTGAAATAALRVDAGLSHSSWVMAQRPESAYHQERVDLAVRGVPLFGGTRLFVNAQALQWTRRPEGFLSPHRSSSQLFVREAAIVRRDAEHGWVFSAGRVWPYRAAGLGLLDGAQVGWQSDRGQWELGAFAGAVPNALNTAPDLSRPRLGAYGAFTHRAQGGVLDWLQQELRVSVDPAVESSSATRIELESITRAWFNRRADAGLDVRYASGLEAVRADVGLRPIDALRFTAAARYDATPIEVLPSVAETPMGHRALRGDASLMWEPASWFGAGLRAGHAQDLETEVGRTWFGPELYAPRVLNGALGLWAGYQEELGWIGGRSAFLQALVRPSSRWDVLARGSWMMSGPNVENGAWRSSEVGGYLSARVALSHTLTLRASALGRLALQEGEDERNSSPFGLTGTAGVAGAF